MTMHTPPLKDSPAGGPPENVEGDISMLAEVAFKWLMAGQGWWIDTVRFHSDPSYAAGFLRLARASSSLALQECAAMVEAEVLGHRRAPQAGLW